MHQDTIADTLKITRDRARLVEAYLRLEHGTLDHLSRVDIAREYRRGGISAAIDADVPGAINLAESFGLFAVAARHARIDGKGKE